MTPEGKVKAEVRKLFKRYGVWYFAPVSNGMGVHGIPDYIACAKGLFIAVECKATSTGKPTALQKVQMDRIMDAGGIAFLATPATLVDLEKLLHNLCISSQKNGPSF